MRVLFTGVGAFGHVLPQLPLARAFRRQGHAVAIMVPQSMAPAFAAEDAEVLAAGADIPSILAELMRRTGVDPMTGMTLEVETEFFVGTRVDLSADESLATARAWQPDLIVHDAYDFVAPLAAAALEVPAALFMVSPAGSDADGQGGYSPEFVRAAEAAAAERYAARGLAPRPATWVLDICPPALQQDDWQAPGGWTPLRPEAHRLPDGLPAPQLRPLTERPRILVTFGTIFGDPRTLSPILRALSATGASLRATLGLTTSAGDYDVEPDTVNFEPFAPLNELLSGIDLVVGAGGAGTTISALGAGIPMVLVPQGADQFVQAERACAAGAALQLLPKAATPEAVAGAVRTVLAESSFRDGAGKIADQVAAMPSPDEVAAGLASALT
jgi:UDP:flavonoid glycosyltransferase YjiC (YdhE family)